MTDTGFQSSRLSAISLFNNNAKFYFKTGEHCQSSLPEYSIVLTKYGFSQFQMLAPDIYPLSLSTNDVLVSYR